jgi:hypothetical protein
MSKRFNLILEEGQYAFLTCESERQSVAVAELIRRAIDHTFELRNSDRTDGFELSVGLWRRPDAAVVGRRPGVTFRRRGQT